MSREQLQYSKHDNIISKESQCDSTDTVLGKRPYQNNNEPSDTAITDDGTATKKQKIYFDSEEQQGPAIEQQSTTSTTVKLGKHLLPSDDKGPDIKRQKPNKESD